MAQNKSQNCFLFAIQSYFPSFSTLYIIEVFASVSQSEHSPREKSASAVSKERAFIKLTSAVEKGPKINASINRDVAKTNFNVFL